MKKINKLGSWYMIMCLAAAILVATLFGACNKNEGRLVTNTKSVPAGTDTVVIQGDGAWGWFIRESYNVGHLHAEHEDGTVVDMMVQLPSELTITPQDTILGMLPVSNGNFSIIGVDSLEEYTYAEIFHLKSKVINFVHTYSYSTEHEVENFDFNGKLTYTEGYAYLWGMKIPVPPANTSISYKDFSTAEAGSDGSWDYTRIISRYNLTRGAETTTVEAYKTLKRAAGSHEFLGKYLANATWTPIAFSNGFVTRIRIDAKIGSRYEGLPDQFTEENIEVDCPVYIPGDSTVYANNFDYTYGTPVVGQEYVTGNYSSGNFNVTNKAINYTVVTSLFTRTSTFGWPEVVWTDGEYTFPMPYHAYGNFNEQHAASDLPAQNGYDRKRVTHTVYATINNNTGHAPINTFVLVESQTPPPPQEGETVLLDSALIYVNETTSISRLTFQVQYPDGTSDAPYNVDCTINNGVESPAEGPFYTSDFNNVGVVGQITLGPITADGQFYDGDFLKKKYYRNATVNCGVFQLTWVFRWQEPYYVPMGNKKMPCAHYSAFVSSGSYTDDLGEITSQNETWLRKIWTQWITTEFNNHNHQYSGTAEVRAPNTIPRITPEWLGNPLEAIYTRVQMAVGSQFMDMIVFRYEHGVVMAPNGVPDLNLVYAFTAADAAAHNVDQVYAAAAWYSGVYFDGKWWPAAITPNSGYTAWTYSYDGTPAHSHTVQRANALILNIGYDYHPIPSHQYYTISNGVITICYNANNQGESVTAQCQLH